MRSSSCLLNRAWCESTRIAAATALGRIGDPSTARDLVAALAREAANHSEEIVQALLALGSGAATAVDDLAGLLLCVRPAGRRRWAARVLREIGPAAAPALPALVSVFSDHPDTDVRTECVRAIGAIGIPDPAAVESLTGALREANVEVRLGASDALLRIGAEPAEAIAMLIDILDQPYLPSDWRAEGRRKRAARALEALGPAAASAVPSLRRMAADQDWHVRRAAERALKAIGLEKPPPVEPSLTEGGGNS